MKHFYSKLITLTLSAAGFVLGFSQYSNGYIVAHEGNFGTSNAEISYIDENNTVTNNVFAAANNGEQLGDVLQNVYFNEDKAYLVLNTSNKVVVADRSSFVKTAVITDQMAFPRYTTIANGKLYTTNVANGFATSYVSVHDATTLEFIKKIALDKSAEEILTINGKVYVQKSYFSAGNSIEVINPETDEIESSIVLNSGLQSMKYKDGFLYAFCSNSSGSTIFKIDPETNTVVNSIGNTAVFSAYKFAVDGDYFFVGKGYNIYRIPNDFSEFSATPLVTVEGSNSWAAIYGLAAMDGKVFQGDASGFVGASVLHVFDHEGTLLNTFNTTIGINNVYKNVFESLKTSESNVAKVSLYPNPVSETLFVKGVEKATYKIFDLSGKIVKSGVYANGIQVSGMAKGMYIIQISENGKTANEKFIVK